MIYTVLVDNFRVKEIPYPRELNKAECEREAYQFAKQHNISERGVRLVHQ